MELIPGLTNDLASECLIRVPFGSFGSFFSVNKAWNTEIRRQDFHRRRRLLGLARPHVVLALMAWPDPDPPPSNKSDPPFWIMVFDPESGSWTRLPPAPRLPFRSMEFCRVAGVGSDIVVVTAGSVGYGITNVVHVFDVLTGQWRHGAELPGPGRVEFGLGCDPVSQRVLLAGGEGERYGAHMKSSLLYDVAKDTWVPMGDMERERSECDVLFQGGRFHVINVIGSDGMRSPVRAESLDHDTWQWGPADESFLDVPNRDVYDRYWVAWNEEGDVYRIRPRLGSDVEVRRGGGGDWRAVAQVPVELRKMSCLMMLEDKMVVIGGPYSSRIMQHDAYLLDLKSCEWRKESLPEDDSSFAHVVSCCGMDL